MTSADRNGIEGLAAYLPSSVSGGARSADEVVVQITISAIRHGTSGGANGPLNQRPATTAQEIGPNTAYPPMLAARASADAARSKSPFSLKQCAKDQSDEPRLA